MWSCFEDLIIRKIIMQFKFNFDAQLSTYDIFNFGIYMHGSNITLLVPICMRRISLWFVETVNLNN